jgi:hypothetical protein
MAHTPSPYAEVADAVAGILDAEFAPEGMTTLHDNLHPAVGAEGSRMGVSIEDETPRAGNMIQNDIAVTVKFYRRWDPDVDIHKKVDPRIIAGFAERFRNAIREYQAPGTNKVWYFNLVRIRYPNDPVGNKSRFEADLVAYGSNSALVETTG